MRSRPIASKGKGRPKGLGKRKKQWETYEEVARYVLQQLGKRFGLSEVEGKQKVIGKQSGTEWEIDAKGVRIGDSSIVLVECRRYKSRLSQEALAAVAYRVIDAGAAGGITVSPLPLQKGAALVAKAGKIEHVQLQRDSTHEQWVATIGAIVHIGITEVVNLSIHEKLEVIVRDRSGNIVDRNTIYGEVGKGS